MKKSHFKTAATVFITAALACSLQKQAEAHQETVEEELEVQEGVDSWGQFAGDLGFGVIGADVFTTLQLGADIREGDMAAGFQAALRLRTVSSGEDRESVIRREDWDEPSDFANIIRYLTYGKDLGFLAFGLNIGVLCPAQLGHGTLLDNYNSMVDLNYNHSGFQAALRHEYFGFDFVMDDFVAPKILALRLEAKFRGFAFGVTGMTDLRAPSRVLLDDDGERRVTKTRKLYVETEPLGFVGYDASYTVGDKKGFWLKPYFDNNWVVGGGGGLHVGVQAGGVFFGGKLQLGGRAEYRVGWNEYAPGYVDLFYDIQRYQISLGDSWRARREGSLETKSAILSTFPSVAHGGKWEAGISYERLFWLRFAYHLREGPLGDMTFLEVGVPYGRRWVFSGLLAKTGLFDKDSMSKADGLLAAAEARVEILKHLYVLGQFRYLYGLDNEGLYRGVVLANLAIGARWGY